MRLKPGKLHYAVISDIHLGHNKNPASRIVENLMAAFPDNAETASLDIIFINGDVFDQLLMFNDGDVLAIERWIMALLGLAKKHGIEVWILEGTPGHDREQSIHFLKANEIYGIGADVHYVRELSIEYLPKHDIHVLFVPDELPGGTEQTLRAVKDLMRAKGLEKVDHAMMHGQFEFQLPPHVHAQKHSSAEYLELVKENIFIGHDHTHKQLDRIYVQGSFDRLGHGYETPKGHMRALQHEDGTWDIKFIENVNAMMFVTADCTGRTLEDTLDCLRQVAVELPEDSHVRVRAEYDNPIFTNMDAVIRIAPFIGWTKDPQRDKKDAIAPVAEVETKYVPITITRDNISELILERIAGQGASGNVMEAATDILGELFPWNHKFKSTTLQAQTIEQ